MEKKNKEPERFNRLFVNRELRIKELKEAVFRGSGRSDDQVSGVVYGRFAPSGVAKDCHEILAKNKKIEDRKVMAIFTKNPK